MSTEIRNSLPEKTGRKKWPIIVVVVLLVVAASAAGLFFYLRNQADTLLSQGLDALAVGYYQDFTSVYPPSFDKIRGLTSLNG